MLDRISALLPSLTPSERRVGEVLLADPERGARSTIGELARRASTSEATVLRFCRSLEIGRYPQLRVALARATAPGAGAAAAGRIAPEIEPQDDLATLVAKVSAADARAIDSTIANLDLAELETVVEAVSSASRIDIYGVAASAFVALDLQQKLYRIGLTAYAWSDPHMALPSAANLTGRDVAIGISHSGTTIDTLDALVEARRAGARTVAITNDPRSPIARAAGCVLRTSVSETALRSGAMVSRIAALTVVDCLFLAVAQRNYDRTLEALDRTRESVRTRHRRSR